MLSVLIPVYNWDIRALVGDLLRQAQDLDTPFEICVLDDASEAQWRTLNRQIADYNGVRYAELPENLGRAAIRNRLGQMANYPWLLFIDGDSGVLRADYLQRYLAHLEPGQVCCGGTQYADTPPSDPSLRLRWKYGRAREQRSAAQRSKDPWAHFSSHHFLVPRALFLDHPFDERLRGYGHEDTLFGQSLGERGTRILHLDNPLLHLGLEPAAVFLEKTRQSTQNLDRLVRQGTPLRTRLGNTASRMRRAGLAPLFRSLYRLTRRPLQRILLGKNPPLWALDVFKIGELLRRQA